MIAVHENYKDYSPPTYVQKAIGRLLSRLPQQYGSGLGAVVLTNGAAIGKGKTRRVGIRKYKRNECLGFYHHATKGEAAWVEIIVDNIVHCYFGPGALRFLSYIPVVREVAFGAVLYHEVGHHLEHTIGPLARGSESTADAWRNKLLRGYLSKQYWYMTFLLSIVRKVSSRVGRRKRLPH